MTMGNGHGQMQHPRWSFTQGPSIAVRGAPTAALPRARCCHPLLVLLFVDNKETGKFVNKKHISILVIGNGSGSWPLRPSLAPP
jgi:hypothetical protein